MWHEYIFIQEGKSLIPPQFITDTDGKEESEVAPFSRYIMFNVWKSCGDKKNMIQQVFNISLTAICVFAENDFEKGKSTRFLPPSPPGPLSEFM